MFSSDNPMERLVWVTAGGVGTLVLGAICFVIAVFVYPVVYAAAYWQGLLVGLAVALLLLPLLSWYAGVLRSPVDWLALGLVAVPWLFAAVGLPVLACGGGLLLNGLFDWEDPVRLEGRIAQRLSTRSTRHRSGTWTDTSERRVTVELLAVDLPPTELSVDAKSYRALHEGQAVLVTWHPGVFGWPWGPQVTANPAQDPSPRGRGP